MKRYIFLFLTFGIFSSNYPILNYFMSKGLNLPDDSVYNCCPVLCKNCTEKTLCRDCSLKHDELNKACDKLQSMYEKYACGYKTCSSLCTVLAVMGLMGAGYYFYNKNYEVGCLSSLAAAAAFLAKNNFDNIFEYNSNKGTKAYHFRYRKTLTRSLDECLKLDDENLNHIIKRQKKLDIINIGGFMCVAGYGAYKAGIINPSIFVPNKNTKL